MSTSKKKRTDPIKDHPDYKPFIVMNDCLQVWVSLANGGRKLIFSDNLDDAKPLHFDSQFKTLKRLSLTKLEQIYL
jgi:hypothetical protein